MILARVAFSYFRADALKQDLLRRLYCHLKYAYFETAYIVEKVLIFFIDMQVKMLSQNKCNTCMEGNSCLKCSSYILLNFISEMWQLT